MKRSTSPHRDSAQRPPRVDFHLSRGVGSPGRSHSQVECRTVLTSQVSKGASRVRIPPSPQGTADIRGVNTTDLAWAAGVYDGEGSASTYLPKRRKSRVRQIAVYQGDKQGVPLLLYRFQTAVGGLGLIHGPSRGSLYQWHAKRHGVVDEVSDLLWPWLSEGKRSQLRRAASEVGRAAPTAADASWSNDELAAWAAGFFDGEGSIGVYGDPRHPHVSMTLPQASDAGVPDTLARFRLAVGAGEIYGPRSVPSPWSKLPQYRWQLARFHEIERVVGLLGQYASVVKLTQMAACVAQVHEARRRRSVIASRGPASF